MIDPTKQESNIEMESEASIKVSPRMKAVRKPRKSADVAAIDIETNVESDEFLTVPEIQIPEEEINKEAVFPPMGEIETEEKDTTEEKIAEENSEEDEPVEEDKEEFSEDVFLNENAKLSAKKSAGNTLSPAANTFDWFKTFLISLAAVIFIFTLVFRGVTVNGDSMLPTLHNNEYLIISDLIYSPKTGDIVVVQSPHFKNGTEPLIKRIIATEGQEVCINFATWAITVDGVILNEDYIAKDDYSTMRCEDMIPDENGEVRFIVEEDCIFVMGDNRNDSLDSRSEAVGQINTRYIMGRVLLRITPLDRFGKVK